MKEISQPMMVMPPVYRFNIPGHSKESGWGWHRATELVEAVNNILRLSSKKPMSPEELNERYPFLKLNRDPNQNFVLGEATSVLIPGGVYGGHHVGEVIWLATLVKMDMYLPAKLGMQLINAVKHPLRSVIRNAMTEAVAN